MVTLRLLYCYLPMVDRFVPYDLLPENKNNKSFHKCSISYRRELHKLQ